MKYLYPLIFLLALIFSHSDMAAEKIYLPQVSWGENNAIDFVIKKVIHEFDSIGISRKEVILSIFYEKNDTLLCIFQPMKLQLIRSKSKTNMRGYRIADNLCFIIISDEKYPKKFIPSNRKKTFIIDNPNMVGAVDGIYLYYMIIGESYKELSYKEWDRLYVDMFVKPKRNNN